MIATQRLLRLLALLMAFFAICLAAPDCRRAQAIPFPWERTSALSATS